MPGMGEHDGRNAQAAVPGSAAFAHTNTMGAVHSTAPELATFAHDGRTPCAWSTPPRSSGSLSGRVQQVLRRRLPLWAVSKEYCRRRYTALRDELANDTHRNYLAIVKTFLRWCVERQWLPQNPAEGIKGVGRWNRGKVQLPLGELLAWDRKAHELAAAGDQGTIAALVALWLGQRASEIVRAKVGHVASIERPGDT